MSKTKCKSGYYTVKRLRLLQYLIERGFEPFAERPDSSNWRYKNWLFLNSPELETALEAYFNEVKNGK